jgi:hypothetical protein
MEFRFTRYLYETDEVKISLMMSILNRNIEKAMFWAAELFYSGLREELTTELWVIFYDYYATLNPNFEKYLVSKIKTEINDIVVLGSIIHNFNIRPSSLDVFMLKCINEQFDISVVPRSNFVHLLKTDNYLMISEYILNVPINNLINLLLVSIDYFNTCGLLLNKTKETLNYNTAITIGFNKVQERSILLSRIIYYFQLKYNAKIGKNLFVIIDASDFIKYKTLNVDLTPQGAGSKHYLLPKLPAYQLLPLAAKYNIDDENVLSLFCLKRDNSDIIYAYRHKWEYCASFTPIWIKRIIKHNGTVNHVTKTIEFENEDDLELFYQEYGLEPDEQPFCVQEKTIKAINTTTTWLDFYNQHNSSGITQLHEYVQELTKVDYK